MVVLMYTEGSELSEPATRDVDLECVAQSSFQDQREKLNTNKRY